LLPLIPACPVKFFEEKERSEFNRGHQIPGPCHLASDFCPLISEPAGRRCRLRWGLSASGGRASPEPWTL